jgi:FAD/FMN-containing dehydrogenase
MANPPERSGLPDGAVDELRRLVGPDAVISDRSRLASVEVDWTGRFRGTTPALVRPRTVEDVSRVLAWCSRAGVAVVPQGGNTGLVGGSVPLHGELVLSLVHLDAVGVVDELALQVTAGAGATLAAVQDAAARHGLRYAVDLAARDQATIGGTVATNAGGVHLLRWGGTRRQLLGVEAVLADGRVVSHLGGLEKDNTGYDLAQLVCGSEGTLAVVTAARLRLVPAPGEVAVALVAFADADAAVAAVSDLRRRLPELQAAELMTDAGLSLVQGAFDRRPPFPRSWPVLVLIEAAATDGATGDTLVDRVGRSVGALAGVEATAVAEDQAGRDELWSYREDHTLAINTLGAPHKLDVTLPLPALAGFLTAVGDRVHTVAPEAEVWLFGHVADGNIHVNVTGIDDEVRGDRVDEVVLGLAAERGGSISAEHGIGAAKRRWLHLNRSPAEIDAFRRIKAALDPPGILNPHVMLPEP